jgi:hypothetical protein
VSLEVLLCDCAPALVVKEQQIGSLAVTAAAVEVRRCECISDHSSNERSYWLLNLQLLYVLSMSSCTLASMYEAYEYNSEAERCKHDSTEVHTTTDKRRTFQYCGLSSSELHTEEEHPVVQQLHMISS